MIRFAIAAGTICLAGLATQAFAVTYNYTDTTFVNGDWVGTKYVDTSSPAAVFTAFQNSPGGSAIFPGPQTPDYRAIRHTYGGPSGGAIVVTHKDVNFNWSPLPLETAATVGYSYDLNYFDGPVGGVGFSPAIFQGGNVYRLALQDQINGPQSGWLRFSGSGIPLTSFFQIDPSTGLVLPGTPNAASAMSFGFTSANSANATSIKFSGLDDYRFTLNTVVAPEPTTFAVVAGLGVMTARRARRREA